MADYGYHEPIEKISEEAQNFHRALKSLQEELEAVDWYHQRAEACSDEALRGIITHNRDEEIEHASMILEWLRRNMPGWEKFLRSYLFSDIPILQIENEMEKSPAPQGPKGGAPLERAGSALVDLGIGNPRLTKDGKKS